MSVDDLTTERCCLNCRKTFASDKQKWFCSTECVVLYRKSQSLTPLDVRNNLIKKLIAVVKDAGVYLPAIELMRTAKVSYYTFKKYKISAIEINRLAGIKKKRFSNEQKAFWVLKEYIPDLESEKIFDDCRSDAGVPLKFDLYSAALSLFVEIDGAHHRWNTKQPELQRLQEHDKIKEAYAVEKAAYFVRISVSEKARINIGDLKIHLKDYVDFDSQGKG